MTSFSKKHNPRGLKRLRAFIKSAYGTKRYLKYFLWKFRPARREDA